MDGWTKLVGIFLKVLPTKLTWLENGPWMKMYFLHNMGDFPARHVSLLEGNPSRNPWKDPVHETGWLSVGFRTSTTTSIRASISSREWPSSPPLKKRYPHQKCGPEKKRTKNQEPEIFGSLSRFLPFPWVGFGPVLLFPQLKLWSFWIVGSRYSFRGWPRVCRS